MKTITTYINDTTLTTERKWGVFIAETSLTALMTPPPMKSYVSNKSTLIDGIQVLEENNNTGQVPKVDEREIQLVLGLRANSLAQFMARYRSFCDELKKRKLILTVVVSEGESSFSETYHLLYNSCSQYSEFNGRLARFVLKVTEPNPTKRTLND